MTANRVGGWAASVVVAVGIVYVIVLAVGLIRFGLTRPIADPILAAMEVLTLLSAPAVLVSFAALREWAHAQSRVWGTVSLAFGTLFTGVTSAVHFAELTAARQVGAGGIRWPSSAYALELLAWDWFLGLALLTAAPIFRTDGDGEDLGAERLSARRRLRRGFRVTGALCLAGTIGPLTGDMRLQRVGIVGYAVALPVVFYWLARHLLEESSDSAVGVRAGVEQGPSRQGTG